MSEFYKKKRDQIIMDYKYLGMKEQISFWLFRFSTVVLIIMLFWYLYSLMNQRDTSGGLITLGVITFMTLTCYLLSKDEKRKHQDNKLNSVHKFINEPDVTIDVIQKLIDEIERYNKKVKTFASWITGLTATFVVLIVTLTTNYFLKIFDICFKIIPEDELTKIIESASQTNSTELFSGIFESACVMLFIFCTVILIIYFMFSILTFIKEQILIFLYDAQYVILSNASVPNNTNPN